MSQSPTITDAKDLATRYRSRGVLILTVTGDAFTVTTYGMTRQMCDAMKSVNDQIAALIADGTIEVPDALRG